MGQRDSGRGVLQIMVALGKRERADTAVKVAALDRDRERKGESGYEVTKWGGNPWHCSEGSCPREREERERERERESTRTGTAVTGVAATLAIQ